MKFSIGSVGSFTARVLGVCFLAGCAVLSYFHDQSLGAIVDFVEQYLSPDQHLEEPAITLIEFHFFSLRFGLLLAGLLMVTPLGAWLLDISQRAWAVIIDAPKLTTFLFADSCLPEATEKRFFVVSSTTALLMWGVVLVIGEPAHEGLLETISVFGFLIAGVLSFFVLFHLRSPAGRDALFRDAPKTGPDNRLLALFLVTMGVGLMVIFGEEVSWGQRLFGWDSFGVFETHNFQQETTLHNFFNPLFNFIYPAVGNALFICSLLFWFFPARETSEFFRLVAPPRSLCVLIFVMAGLTFKGHSEAFEELLAVFFLLYVYRLGLITRR